MATDTELLNEIRRAWREPGRYPRWHRMWQRRLRDEWPVLAAALDKL